MIPCTWAAHASCPTASHHYCFGPILHRNEKLVHHKHTGHKALGWVWDVERPDEPILSLFGVFALSRSAFAAELPRFAVAVSQGAAVYDLRSGLLYSRLSSARGLSILEAGISNSGFHVATREDTGPVLLHDVETEEPVFVVGGHGFGTGSIEFDSLGLTLTSRR